MKSLFPEVLIEFLFGQAVREPIYEVELFEGGRLEGNGTSIKELQRRRHGCRRLELSRRTKQRLANMTVRELLQGKHSFPRTR